MNFTSIKQIMNDYSSLTPQEKVCVYRSLVFWQLPKVSEVSVSSSANGDVFVLWRDKEYHFRKSDVDSLISNLHHRTLSAWGLTELNRARVAIISGEGAATYIRAFPWVYEDGETAVVVSSDEQIYLLDLNKQVEMANAA